MSDQMILASIGVITGLIAIVTPIIRLNANIVKLTTVVEQLEKLVKDKTDNLDKRVTEHGKQIDQLAIDVAKHETRLNELDR